MHFPRGASTGLLNRISPKRQSAGQGGFCWRYLPRESNHTADFLAGLASQLLADLRSEFASPEELAALAPIAAVRHFVSAVYRPVVDASPQFWEAARVALTDNEAPSVAIWELPDFSQWEHLAVLRQFDPARGRCLTALCLAAVLRAHNSGYPVEYRAKALPRFGRLYPTTASGANLGKQAGLILFGATHCEVDMGGAHFCIFIELIKTFFTSPC